MQSNPADRPSAEQALRYWLSIRRNLGLVHRVWMPRERTESFHIIFDIFHIFSLTSHTIFALGRSVRRFLG